ncbi:MAG: Fe(3+) ABC transporter substrate-binding protein [Hyphomicrobiales bacterium]
MRLTALSAIVAATASLSALGPARADGEVNVYSYRQPYLVNPLFDAFTKQTGIKVNVIFAKKGLIERMAAEGRNSPADVLLTVDIGRLTSAVKNGVSQAVSSPVLQNNVPANYRDPEGHWFGLTRRARVVYASKARVKQSAITYEELADPKWKGRICIRSGQHVYNVALIASMIAHHGEDKAKAWLQGVKANLAGKPSGNDRAQVKRVYAGECDLAIANTYYMAKMALNEKQPEQKEWAASVKMLFPNAADRGTHVNLSGVILAKHAPHRANGIRLMEFLSGEQAQGIYASTNHEYPVTDGVALSEMVTSWGELTADTLSLEKISKLRDRASQMVDEVLFNEGPTS